MEPKVLLADEPTGNLDSKSGAEIIRIIEALNEDGIALLVVTHDPEIGRRAKRHLSMRDGKVFSDQPRPAA
jgi:putative ABC transport system ATP-binding protein